MRKGLSLLIAMLMILVPALAVAEEAADMTYTTYKNPTNGYAIDYPESWTLVSKETMQSVMDSIAGGETKIDGLDSSKLEAYKAQIESMDMVMFISPDGAVNANVTYQAVPAKIASEQILKQVCPLVKQQFEGVFQNYKEMANPQAVTVGDLEYVETAGQYTLSGAGFIMLQAYYCTDSALYTVTYTIDDSMNPDKEAIDAISTAMLASFAPV